MQMWKLGKGSNMKMMYRKTAYHSARCLPSLEKKIMELTIYTSVLLAPFSILHVYGFWYESGCLIPEKAVKRAL